MVLVSICQGDTDMVPYLTPLCYSQAARLEIFPFIKP